MISDTYGNDCSAEKLSTLVLHIRYNVDQGPLVVLRTFFISLKSQPFYRILPAVFSETKNFF